MGCADFRGFRCARPGARRSNRGKWSSCCRERAKAHPELPKVPLSISFAKTRRGAPTDRSRHSSAERGHLWLFVAARHAEGSRADFAQSIFANCQRSRLSRTTPAKRIWRSRRFGRRDRADDSKNVQDAAGSSGKTERSFEIAMATRPLENRPAPRAAAFIRLSHALSRGRDGEGSAP